MSRHQAKLSTRQHNGSLILSRCPKFRPKTFPLGLTYSVRQLEHPLESSRIVIGWMRLKNGVLAEERKEREKLFGISSNR